MSLPSFGMWRGFVRERFVHLRMCEAGTVFSELHIFRKGGEPYLSSLRVGNVMVLL